MAATPVAVVLIDNDADTRRAVQLRLHAGGFAVRAYASGWTMLADTVSLAARPACIIVRDAMGDIDGFELLRRVRSSDWHGPAILVTSAPSLALATAAARAGFAAVVDRPLVDDLMLDAVNAAARKPVWLAS